MLPGRGYAREHGQKERERREFPCEHLEAARDGEADNIVSLCAARDVGLFVIFIRVCTRIAGNDAECNDNVNRASAESQAGTRDFIFSLGA